MRARDGTVTVAPRIGRGAGPSDAALIAWDRDRSATRAPPGALTMPNLFTRVPERPVPSLKGLGLLIVAADAFMVAMISRPATGSLRTTWVTPATLALCAATAAGAAVAAGWVVVRGVSALSALAAAALAAAALGAACVLAVGVWQRRAT